MPARPFIFVLATVVGTFVSVATAATPKARVEPAPAQETKAAPAAPARGSDPSTFSGEGWTNLLQDPRLEDWQRVPLPVGRPPAARSQWSCDPATGYLMCTAVSDEMLLHRTPRGNGVLRVEWRFPGGQSKPSGGIMVRTKPDHSAWFQSDLSVRGAGTLLGGVAGKDGAAKRITIGSRRANVFRTGDEWNVTEITCVGTRLILHLNGVVVADWNECNVAEALIGIKVEGAPIECRRILFKPMP